MKLLIKLMFMNMAIQEGKADEALMKDLAKSKEIPQCVVIETRLFNLGYNIHLLALIFLSTLIESAGEAVMYAHYIQSKEV